MSRKRATDAELAVEANKWVTGELTPKGWKVVLDIVPISEVEPVTVDKIVTQTWGLYPWFPECGIEHIHPDDLAVVQTFSPYGSVCEIVGNDGSYFVIRFGPHQFRGKPELFKQLPCPAFRVGQAVKTKPPRSLRTGVIRGLSWHHKMNAFVYFLEVNGKSVSSRYWAEELEAA